MEVLHATSYRSDYIAVGVGAPLEPANHSLKTLVYKKQWPDNAFAATFKAAPKTAAVPFSAGATAAINAFPGLAWHNYLPRMQAYHIPFGPWATP
jgi:hypothetical protein